MTEQTLSIETIAPRTPLQEFWFYFKQNKGAVIGLIFILVVALISIFAPWIAPFDPIEQNDRQIHYNNNCSNNQHGAL